MKPIFGARYPPLSENKGEPSEGNPMNAKNGQRFKQYESRFVKDFSIGINLFCLVLVTYGIVKFRMI